MNTEKLTILLVEDDPAQANLIERSLETVPDWNAVVVHVDRLINALLAIKDNQFDAILLDLTLPDSDGLDTLVDMVQCSDGTPVIVLSGADDPELEREAIVVGAQEYIKKGSVTPDVLIGLIRHAVERHSLQFARDRKLVEASALHSQFRSLIVDNGDAMVVLDENDIVRFLNPAAEKLFGRSGDAMLGTKIDIPLYKGREVEMEIVTPDGRHSYVEILVMPTVWEGRQARLATLRDITRLKKIERELRRSAEAAKEASDLKSAFLANMSHELRTPLNSIIGFSELIETQSFGPVGHPVYEEYAGLVKRSGFHLLSLINDLLDLSKAEADAMELNETEFDLPALVRDCVSTLLPDARKGRLRIDQRIDRIRLFGDEQRFTQIMLNILSNAIKFTPEGGRVAVSASILASGKLMLRVADSGIGISKSDLRAVFGQFVRADADYVSRREGTGLGLTISKTFVELHGGGIDIDSTLGKGTVVSIVLPSDRVLADVVDLETYAPPRRLTA